MSRTFQWFGCYRLKKWTSMKIFFNTWEIHGVCMIFFHTCCRKFLVVRLISYNLRKMQIKISKNTPFISIWMCIRLYRRRKSKSGKMFNVICNSAKTMTVSVFWNLTEFDQTGRASRARRLPHNNHYTGFNVIMKYLFNSNFISSIFMRNHLRFDAMTHANWLVLADSCSRSIFASV